MLNEQYLKDKYFTPGMRKLSAETVENIDRDYYQLLDDIALKRKDRAAYWHTVLQRNLDTNGPGKYELHLIRELYAELTDKSVLLPLPMLARKDVFNPINEKINPRNYVFQEKYDGWRAIWTGHKMISRTGKTLSLPKWFTDKLPRDQQLDGEIWLGYKTLGKLNGLMKRKRRSGWEAWPEWKDLFFRVYDIPGASVAPYIERHKQLESIVSGIGSDRVLLTRNKLFTTMAELDAELAYVVENDGEGLIFRTTNSRYIPGRRAEYDVIKYKPIPDPIQCIVSDKLAKTGVYVDTLDGMRFLLKTKETLVPGSTVTVRYTEVTGSGKPANGQLIT